jgi:tetratricopeptide (TPR) repeat protein
MRTQWLGLLAVVSLVGCAHRVAKPVDVADGKPQMSVRENEEDFADALEAFARHDARGDWDAEACRAVSQEFVRLGSKGRLDQRGEAFYNAGLARQRCQQNDGAREMFEAALRAEPGMHRAQAQLVLFEFEATGDRDGAIARLDEVIRAARFQNVEALVNLAALQLDRGIARNDSDDFDAARQNLQRALAIDDNYMPALNQLALLQLASARAQAGVESSSENLVLAGAERPQLSQQQLDMAALIASQGIRKNARYAPLHNTAGLVQVELRDYNQAIQSFKRARELDPGFFEAHMNYGAVNLGIRGFAEAERAYRAALKLEPKSYEAHLGLALAVRGQITPGADGQRVAEAERHLEAARQLAPQRPEAYYNAAILAQEFRAKSGSERDSMQELEAAYCLYGDFVARAPQGDSEAKVRATNRRQDIVDMLRFMTNDPDRKVSCG